MPNDTGNNTTNNDKNKFPNQGNFSASQNNVASKSTGKFGSVKDIATNSMNNTKNMRNMQNMQNMHNMQNTQNIQDSDDDLEQEKKLTDDPDNMADSVKKEAAKKGIEALATAYGGSAGGKAAKAIMDSELGNKVLNAATNATKPKNVIKFAAIGSGISCFGSILMVAIIATVILAPIFYAQEFFGAIAQGAQSVWKNIVYFFKGCDSEEACKQKEQDSFYDTLLEVKDEYEEKYSITLNTDLIVATLTYYDPNDIMSSDDGSTTDLINFKKSKKKIKDLAENMLGEGKQCVDLYGNVIIQYKEDEKSKECPNPTIEYYIDEKGKQQENKVKAEKWYYLDDDKYKKYLEDEFISDFFFKGKNDDKTKEKITLVINDIYSRVEMVKYLNGSENTSTNFVANNSQVAIMDCTGTIELATVSLYEYLQGVLYIEGYATARSEEFLKVQAVIAKNYLYALNGATPDSIPTTLKIRSCQMDQLYCSVEDGCHNLEDGKTDAYNTIAPGPSLDGTYYRKPITDVATLQKIKSAIDSTLTDFIIKDNKFVTTQYRASCSMVCDSTTNILDQAVANQMIESGSTYIDVLNHFYDGTIQKVTLSVVGYPLDLVNNNVTSAFGWRVHPVYKYCRTHNGTDIAAPADANIYSIADGVVVDNYYNSSYGNVTIIGHGSYIDGNYEYYSLYAHQIRLSTHINIGQEVKAGQVIGNVGSTGTSTGNHLHIEIYTMKNGVKERQDPVEYFKSVELTGKVGGTLYGNEAQCKACLNTYGASNC